MKKQRKVYKGKGADPEHEADVISELLELAGKLGLPDGAFDGDIEDECDHEARINAENVKNGPLMGQLEFLWEHGYGKNRLAELIREYAGQEP